MKPDKYRAWLEGQPRDRIHRDQVIKQAERCIGYLEGEVERLQLELDKALERESNRTAVLTLTDGPADVETEALIRQMVTDHVIRDFGIRASDLNGRRKTRNVTWARQCWVWIVMQLTGMPCVEVARLLDRNHTTVLWLRNRVEQAIKDRTPLGGRAERLLRTIRAAVEDARDNPARPALSPSKGRKRA